MNKRLRKTGSFWALLGALAGTLGCSSTTEGPADATDRKAPTATEADVPASPSSELPMPRGTVVSFEAELTHVSEIRGLASRGKLFGLEVSESEIHAHVGRAVSLEMPDKALVGTEAMLVGLGVVPLSFEYRETMLRLLAGKLAGLYDPHLKAMLIREGLGSDERKMTLMHELVHALQDQNYDLSKISKWAPDQTDRSGALSALAEGDATSTMFDAMMKPGETALLLPPQFIQDRIRSDASGPEGIPTIINRSLKVAYIDGVTFAHALRRRGGWNELDRVWKNPPTTSEQVLHLEKYDAQEKAINVPIPPPPSDGFTVVLSDVWGEQNLRLVYEEWMPLEAATSAAAGWGGDRIVVYQKGESTALSWHLVADNEKEAIQMLDAFIARLSTKKPASSPANKVVTCGSAKEDAPPLAVARVGTHVVIAGSPIDRKNGSLGSCDFASEWALTQVGQLKPD